MPRKYPDVPSEERCSEEIPEGRGFHYHQCPRRGTVERDGRLYCRQHDPEAIAERRRQRDNEWAAHEDRSRAAAERAAALARRIGAGRPDYAGTFGRSIGRYTGGLTLTETEAKWLADELERLRDVRHAHPRAL